MASILKVDTLQKPDGSTPTAADLGLDVSGSVVQVQHLNLPYTTVPSTTSTTWISTGYGLDITPKYANSKLVAVLNYCAGTSTGAPYIGIMRDGVAFGADGFVKHQTDYSWAAYTATGAITKVMDAGTTNPTNISIMFANDTAGTTYINSAGGGYGKGSTSLTVYEIAQ